MPVPTLKAKFEIHDQQQSSSSSSSSSLLRVSFLSGERVKVREERKKEKNEKINSHKYAKN